MTSTTEPTSTRLETISPRLLRTAGAGGLLGGTGLFLVMAGYNAANSMGFWAILNSCFAAFVCKSAGMTSMTGEPAMPGETGMAHAMTGQPIVASHVVVGTLLHLAMSIGAGVAFAVALAVLLRAGLRILSTAAGYLLGGAAGGALLYLIMMEAVAPHLNRTVVEFTPRVPFFLAHLLFGATVAGYVYWRTATATHAPGGRAARLRTRAV
jgi:hypothetical protein